MAGNFLIDRLRFPGLLTYSMAAASGLMNDGPTSRSIQRTLQLHATRRRFGAGPSFAVGPLFPGNIRREQSRLSGARPVIRRQSPELYLVPSTAWLSSNGVFVERNHEGLMSSPEWRITISRRNRQALAPYAFESTVGKLIDE